MALDDALAANQRRDRGAAAPTTPRVQQGFRLRSTTSGKEQAQQKVLRTKEAKAKAIREERRRMEADAMAAAAQTPAHPHGSFGSATPRGHGHFTPRLSGTSTLGRCASSLGGVHHSNRGSDGHNVAPPPPPPLSHRCDTGPAMVRVKSPRGVGERVAGGGWHALAEAAGAARRASSVSLSDDDDLLGTASTVPAPTPAHGPASPSGSCAVPRLPVHTLVHAGRDGVMDDADPAAGSGLGGARPCSPREQQDHHHHHHDHQQADLSTGILEAGDAPAAPAATPVPAVDDPPPAATFRRTKVRLSASPARVVSPRAPLIRSHSAQRDVSRTYHAPRGGASRGPSPRRGPSHNAGSSITRSRSMDVALGAARHRHSRGSSGTYAAVVAPRVHAPNGSGAPSVGGKPGAAATPRPATTAAAPPQTSGHHRTRTPRGTRPARAGHSDSQTHAAVRGKVGGSGAPPINGVPIERTASTAHPLEQSFRKLAARREEMYGVHSMAMAGGAGVPPPPPPPPLRAEPLPSTHGRSPARARAGGHGGHGHHAARARAARGAVRSATPPKRKLSGGSGGGGGGAASTSTPLRQRPSVSSVVSAATPATVTPPGTAPRSEASASAASATARVAAVPPPQQPLFASAPVNIFGTAAGGATMVGPGASSPTKLGSGKPEGISLPPPQTLGNSSASANATAPTKAPPPPALLLSYTHMVPRNPSAAQLSVPAAARPAAGAAAGAVADVTIRKRVRFTSAVQPPHTNSPPESEEGLSPTSSKTMTPRDALLMRTSSGSS